MLGVLLVTPFTLEINKCDDNVVEDVEPLWGDKEGRGVFTAKTKAGLGSDKGGDVGSGGAVVTTEGDELCVG